MCSSAGRQDGVTGRSRVAFSGVSGVVYVKVLLVVVVVMQVRSGCCIWWLRAVVKVGQEDVKQSGIWLCWLLYGCVGSKWLAGS